MSRLHHLQTMNRVSRQKLEGDVRVMSGAPFNGNASVLPSRVSYSGSVLDAIKTPAGAASWYAPRYGCLTWDPTVVARRHLFPDAHIPEGVPLDPGAAERVCRLEYRNAWPAESVDATAMVLTEMEHPQFAFRAGGPATPYQIDVESQLRRLDQPLGKCQAIIPEDAPLHQNTVAPPVPTGVPLGPQMAANPPAAILRPGEACRDAADAVASAMSGRWVNNCTRQDTMRMDLPFAPPGIGRGAARGPMQPTAGLPYYTN